jgi:hypothetical protein
MSRTGARRPGPLSHLLVLLLLCAKSAAGEEAQPDTTAVEIWRVPALATEDTFGVLVKYEMRTIEVQAKRLSLRDILERAREGERRRREAVEDLAYTERIRVTLLGGRGGASDRRRFFEHAARVYWKRPGKHLRVELGEREYGDQDVKEKLQARSEVQVEMFDVLDFAQGPFYLENLDEYRYELKDRRLFPDRVLYAVDFTPRSDFDPLPGGVFWIDTADFVIVHEDMEFERNPLPIFFESIDHIVRERKQIDGRWVVNRLQMVAEMRAAFIVGFDRVELEATFSDFAFNTQLPDSLFRDAKR